MRLAARADDDDGDDAAAAAAADDAGALERHGEVWKARR